MHTYTPIEFSIPPLEGISQKQIDEHLTLYKGYVAHVNKLYEEMDALAKEETRAHEISELRRRLGFEFCGMRLHEYYFGDLVGGASALSRESALMGALVAQYGSFESFLSEFKNIVARGSGWMIVNYDTQAKRFHLNWVDEHHIGHLATLPVVVAIDMWEHAYMVDYLPGEKKKYIEHYLNALNWGTVSSRFEA